MRKAESSKSIVEVVQRVVVRNKTSDDSMCPVEVAVHDDTV